MQNFCEKKLTIGPLLTKSLRRESQMTSKSEVLESNNNFAKKLWIFKIIGLKCWQQVVCIKFDYFIVISKFEAPNELEEK